MMHRNAYARIEQISIQALWCKWVRVVMRQLGTVLNRLQVNYATLFLLAPQFSRKLLREQLRLMLFTVGQTPF